MQTPPWLLHMDKLEYTLIRSDRKTIGLRLDSEGRLTVRAPKHMSAAQIELVLRRHAVWIEKQKIVLKQHKSEAVQITPGMRKEGIRRAREVFPARTAHFARIMGVRYGTITIREQKTRWGSCSSGGNLSFNWKLVLLEPELLDYVVVHELAHRLEMNHSSRFWAIVESILPDYRILKKRLQKEGARFRSE